LNRAGLQAGGKQFESFLRSVVVHGVPLIEV
jgi:hypothetical protein